MLDRSPAVARVDDELLWSIVSCFVSKPRRCKGLNRALIEAAIEYTNDNGARTVETHPPIPENSVGPRHERHTGIVSTFEAAVFEVAIGRSCRRPKVRYFARH